MGGRIGIFGLYIKNILTTRCGVWCRCLPSREIYVYYELKVSMSVKGHEYSLSGRSACYKLFMFRI
jgi:hypothetical protein